MERNITITLEKAREWYNSDNESLKEVALQAFSKEELDTFDFTKIKTFEDALNALGYNESIKVYIRNTINDISMYSRASAAMSQLNIVRKALNLGQDLHLTKNPENSLIYCPYTPFITEESTYYKTGLESGKVEIIGKFKNEGTLYNVIGGAAIWSNYAGLGYFLYNAHAGYSNPEGGFFGCASEKIARHFGKYFGMLIMEAKYGDMVDFEIVENKYQ